MNVKNISCNMYRECWTKYKRIDELFKNHVRLAGTDLLSSSCSYSNGCTKMVVKQIAKLGIIDNETCYERHMRCMYVLI